MWVRLLSELKKALTDTFDQGFGSDLAFPEERSLNELVRQFPSSSNAGDASADLRDNASCSSISAVDDLYNQFVGNLSPLRQPRSRLSSSRGCHQCMP
jgi:hypothetical protein